MGVLRVDHPDIEEFVRAKQNEDRLRAFNISVAVTDEFMNAVQNGESFDLRFNGMVYKTIDARNLWEEIMRSTWDWAEPGILFIDRINEMNNLWYCEQIAATNPCGEQPLPPYGACLLGSFNLAKYIIGHNGDKNFDTAQLEADIPVVVRAFDNIHDLAVFPLEQQREESHQKRRMGLGVTGVANAGEILGHVYGSQEFLDWFESVLKIIRDGVYNASVDLAAEKGAFPAYSKEYLKSRFITFLPEKLQRRIARNGIRNSHLLSIAPTGTISLAADNVSSGIEPVFSRSYTRTIQTFEGPREEKVEDYAYRVFGVQGKTANECSAQEHLSVLALAQRYVDSSVSKTINCDPSMAWNDFKEIYYNAWIMGAKGVTTFNSGGKRYGVLRVQEDTDSAEACYIDEKTGKKSCE